MNMKLTILFFIIPILLSSNICFSQEQDSESSSILLIYGSENYRHAKAQEFVATKWGIKIYRIAGVTVDKKIVDSAAIVNSNLWTRFDKILHKDSKKLFKKEVISEMIYIGMAQSIYDTNRKLQRAIHKIENKQIKTYSELKSKEDDLTYVYIITGYPKNDMDVQSKLLKVTINIGTKTLQIEDLKPKGKLKKRSSFIQIKDKS